MKTYLLVLCLLIAGTLCSQHLKLVEYQGKPSREIMYNYNEDHVKLACWYQVAGNQNLSVRANVANLDSFTATGVRLRVDAYDIYWSNFGTLYSGYADSIAPSDTLAYDAFTTDSLTTDNSFWRPSQPLGGYYTQRLVLSLETDSGLIGPLDTVWLKPSMYGQMVSTDFGNRDTYIGTSTLGEDGCALAWLVPVSFSYNTVIGDCGWMPDPTLELPVSPGSLSGGDGEVLVFDTVAGGNLLYSTSFNSQIVQTAYGPKLFVDLSGFNQALDLDAWNVTPKYVWIVVTLFSDFGDYPVDIACDTSEVQPDVACRAFHVSQGIWHTKNSLAALRSSPAMTLNWTGGTLSTAESQQFEEITLYPNPASDYFSLRGLKNETIDVRIYNIVGEKVLETQGISEGQPIRISDRPAGLYLVEFTRKGLVVQSQYLSIKP